MIVLKEGSFTLRENILENPKFAYELSTLRADYRHSIDARFNWWEQQRNAKSWTESLISNTGYNCPQWNSSLTFCPQTRQEPLIQAYQDHPAF